MRESPSFVCPPPLEAPMGRQNLKYVNSKHLASWIMGISIRYFQSESTFHTCKNLQFILCSVSDYPSLTIVNDDPSLTIVNEERRREETDLKGIGTYH